MANKSGKDKDSYANTKPDKRKDFNGRVVLLLSFEVFVESFFLRTLLKYFTICTFP